MGNRRRRRSTAIRLVLAGSAALAGCDAPLQQRDAYASIADCVRDWNDAAQCQPVTDGRYSRGYYYGPPYYGASLPDGRPRPSPSAMDAVRLAPARSSSPSFRSGFSSGGFSGASRSSSSSSHGTSRGGFGSTGRSFSSSGS